MFSKAPDSAARSFIYTSVFWLVVGGTLLAIAAAKLPMPGFLSTKLLSYGRMRASGSISIIYGWLSLSGFAACCYIVPRLTGVRLRSETAPQWAGVIVSVVVILSIAITMFGGVQDQAFTEVPKYLDVFLVVAFLIVAATVVATVTRRVEERVYVSLFYLVGGLIWAPLTLIAGMITAPGVPGSIAHLFEINSFALLWLASVGIGSLYYVIPRASGGSLYSHRLALIGFWSLALAAPLAGQARFIFGPAPDWLETISIAAGIVLLIPALSVLVNLFGTLRGAWGRVPDHPSVRFFVAGTVLFSVASLQFVVQSTRTVARNVGLTQWGEAQVWLLLLGAFTLWMAGLLTFAAPRLIGRRWLRPTSLSSTFWLSIIGVATVWAGQIATGIITASVLVGGTATERPLSTHGWVVLLGGTTPFMALSFLGFLAFTIGQWLLVFNLVQTTSSGEVHPIEIVQPGELLT